MESVILTLNETVLSTSVILSSIEFNSKIENVSSKTLLPSNSNDKIIPSAFWIVNAVNSYVPIIEKKSLTFFGVVWNTPSEFDLAPIK